MPAYLSHSMYFAAIVCPGRINEKILLFKNRMKAQFGYAVALKSPAHITLVPPFWLENERENELLLTLGAFSTDPGPFDIRLEGFDHFRKRVLFIAVMENPALNRLKELVETHFHSAFPGNINKDDRLFHPHVTIANRDMQLTHFEKAWEYFSKTDYAETFAAGAISLLKLVEGKWVVIGEKIGENQS